MDWGFIFERTMSAMIGPEAMVFALAAVGSYGRGTLSLKSDVDVIFLCDDPGEPHLAALSEAFLYPLWDQGLKVGHAVRGLDETLALAREDISTATTLRPHRSRVVDRRLPPTVRARIRMCSSPPPR